MEIKLSRIHVKASGYFYGNTLSKRHSLNDFAKKVNFLLLFDIKMIFGKNIIVVMRFDNTNSDKTLVFFFFLQNRLMIAMNTRLFIRTHHVHRAPENQKLLAFQQMNKTLTNLKYH